MKFSSIAVLLFSTMASNASGQCTEFANKIKIQSSTGEPLSLREVRVYSGEVNVAIGGNATQSSDLNDDSGASKAVDGKWRTKATTNTTECAMWWEVDLEESTAINKVVMVNPDKGCDLSHATISLLNGDDEYTAAKIVGNTCDKGWVVRKFEIDCPTKAPTKAPTAAPTCDPNPPFIKSYLDSTMCMSLENAGTVAGTNVWMYPCDACNGLGYQSWRMDEDTGHIHPLVEGGESLCIHAPSFDWSTNTKMPLTIEACADVPEQKFTWTDGAQSRIQRTGDGTEVGGITYTTSIGVSGGCGGITEVRVENQQRFDSTFSIVNCYKQQLWIF